MISGQSIKKARSKYGRQNILIHIAGIAVVPDGNLFILQIAVTRLQEPTSHRSSSVHASIDLSMAVNRLPLRLVASPFNKTVRMHRVLSGAEMEPAVRCYIATPGIVGRFSTGGRVPKGCQTRRRWFWSLRLRRSGNMGMDLIGWKGLRMSRLRGFGRIVLTCC